MHILIKPLVNTQKNLRSKGHRYSWPQESPVDSAETTLTYNCGQLSHPAAKALSLTDP